MKDASPENADDLFSAAEAKVKPKKVSRVPGADRGAALAGAEGSGGAAREPRKSSKRKQILSQEKGGNGSSEADARSGAGTEEAERDARLPDTRLDDLWGAPRTSAAAAAAAEAAGFAQRRPVKRRVSRVENSLEASPLLSAVRSNSRPAKSDTVRELEAGTGTDVDQKVVREPSLRARLFGAFTKGNGEPQEPARLDSSAPDVVTGPEPGERSFPMPDAVKKRFLRVDNDYFFADKTPAFSDRGNKLSTKGEHHEVIRSLVLIAQTRGWDSVTVRGSKQFRAATWLEASMAGMKVAGYQASKVEQAELVQRRGRVAKTGGDVTSERVVKQPRTASGLSQSSGEFARQQASEVVTGKLLEHGQARYQNDPKKGNSYFVKVRTKQGDKTLWGVDLARAVVQSGVVIGETISLQRQESTAVTAQERIFDAEGKEAGTRSVDAHKNTWRVGSLDKAQAFLTGERAQVVQQYPDLAPVYGTVAASRKFAEKNFPEHTERFVAIGKKILAEKIASGEHLPMLDIRETVGQKNQNSNLTKKL